VLGVGKKQVTLNVAERVLVPCERRSAFTVLAAMPKGDRGDFLVEKLVELGVTQFIPLLTERSVVEPKANRIENLRRTVIEASKQCGRNSLMKIEVPLAWERAARMEFPGLRVILHPSGSAAFSTETGAVAIGPEGGFSEREMELAIRAEWHAVTLGPRILRIETAAIAAAAITNPAG
jgi:16S rRNA (uracil1498-N3)-methyltransferase